MNIDTDNNAKDKNLDDIHVTAKDGRTIAIVHGIEGWLLSSTIIKALRAAYACGDADARAEMEAKKHAPREFESARAEGDYCLERR